MTEISNRATGMRPAVTLSLVPEARGGPFVFWEDLDQAFAKAAALGFDAIEIFPPSAGELDRRTVERLLAVHSLNLAALGTGAGWVVRKLRLTDPDPHTRERARQFAREIIALAGQWGAPAIIGSLQGRAESGADRPRCLEWLAGALEELSAESASFQVPLLLEPLNRYETNLLSRVDDALAFLAEHRLDNVKLLCDLFHMNIEEASIPEALRQAGTRLGHVHLADSNRRAAGFGHTGFAPIARALHDTGYRGWLSAEVLPLPDPDQAAAQTVKAFHQFFARAA